MELLRTCVIQLGNEVRPNRTMAPPIPQIVFSTRYSVVLVKVTHSRGQVGQKAPVPLDVGLRGSCLHRSSNSVCWKQVELCFCTEGIPV